MKVLLAAINSKYIHSNLAVFSLQAYAQEHLAAENTENVIVEVAEYTINQNQDSIWQDIYLRKPDVVAFSCYIWNITGVCRISREIKKILPQVRIWLGGPEVTYDSISVLKRNPQIDCVMRGEGEATFAELIHKVFGTGSKDSESEAANAVCQQGQFAGVLGITYRNFCDGGIESNPDRPLLSMDELPFIYHNEKQFANRIIYYESSRGCPFGCSYCLSSVERSVRFRSMDKVKQELQFFLDRNYPQVKFVDRTFNCNHKRTLELLEFIREHDNGVTNFHFEISADLLREEELQVVESLRPGLVQMEIGVQSANPDTITEIDRTMNLSRLEAVVQRLNRAQNVHIHLDLIAGLPGEDYASFCRSFNEIYAMHPEQLQLGFLKVLKGSKMHRKASEYGLIYTDEPPYEVMATKWLSFDDILQLKRVEEVLEHYYNSGQYRHTMAYLEQYFPSAYAVYDALAAYYMREHLFEIKHSRIGRYEILVAFVREMTECGISECNLPEHSRSECDAAEHDSGTVPNQYVFEQTLLYDLYLRENLKSRPAFAEDNSAWKERARDLYAQINAERGKKQIFILNFLTMDARRYCLIIQSVIR